jgi:hypothetical protein
MYHFLVPIEPVTRVASTLADVGQFVSAIIWPLVILVIAMTQRHTIKRLLNALATLAESANRIKLWEVEIERNIDQEVDKAGKTSQAEVSPKIAKEDVRAAARVETLVSRLPESPTREDLLRSVRSRMMILADSYDQVRLTMPSSRDRTIAMNGLVAQMRTLALAAKPFLKEFSSDSLSAGLRLCAIAILQMEPEAQYLDWLGKRFSVEQPFVFYQASIALIEMARIFRGTPLLMELTKTIESALRTLNTFTAGFPDSNSIQVLESALTELRTS